MKYCQNCGKKLPENVKFCPYCGAKVEGDLNESTKASLKKQKMEKGVVKRLKSEVVYDIESEIENSIAKQKKESAMASYEAQSGLEENENLEDETGTYSFPNTTIGIYFILNFILMMGSPNSDEIMGIFIYTWIVLLIIFIRRNKEKPFNWLLNIFVSLQALLVFATSMMTIEYLGAGSDDIGVVLQLGLLILLLVTIIVLLYKGNRRIS